ncbi:MAG: ABC transporter ATP-binding protein [Kiritimatiellia bacterium]
MSEAGEAPVVVVENLEKIFRDFWMRPRARAVNGISFDIRRGEVFGLLGPNGSGKSTTIKILLGLLHPTRGRVAVLGRSPRDVKAKARVGYLPEESNLYPYLSARETIDFYGKLFDIPASERRRRTDQLLEMVGLQHTGRRRVGEFSKGMMRRVGLAQALINDPDFIILDEPTSGLDPVGCRQFKDLIVTLARRGKTVLLSSHLLADVEDVCDRIAILYGGAIQAMGPIRDLLRVGDRLRISVPSVPAGRMEDLRALLQRELGVDPEMDNPSRSLEQYFMEIVEKARASSQSTSGAEASDRVADYLAASISSLPAASPVPEPRQPAAAAAFDRDQAEQRLRHMLPPDQDA